MHRLTAVQAAKQYNELADSIEKHFETVADQIRDIVPRGLGLTPPPPPPRRLMPVTYVESAQRWIMKNKAITAGVIAFLSTGSVLVYLQRQRAYTKRRAKRASNGARTEIVGENHKSVETMDMI